MKRGEKKKKAGSSAGCGHTPPCAATWSLHHIRKSLTLLSSKKLGMPCHILRVKFLLTRREKLSVTSASTKKKKIHANFCICILYTAQASSQHEICCVMLGDLHTQSLIVDTWLLLVPNGQVMSTTSHSSSVRKACIPAAGMLNSPQCGPAAMVTQRFSCQKTSPAPS